MDSDRVPLLEALVCEGGGFHAFWYSLGKGSVLRERFSSIKGWSSGAMSAVLLATLPRIDFAEVISAALKTKDNVSMEFGGLHRVVAYFLDLLLPEDAHLTCSGTLGIILCDPRECFRGRVVSTWASRSDLISCVVASTYFPGIVGACPTDPCYGCIDGGLSWNLKDLTLSAFTTTGPAVGFIECFKPITEDQALDLFERGMYDAIKLIS